MGGSGAIAGNRCGNRRAAGSGHAVGDVAVRGSLRHDNVVKGGAANGEAGDG